MSFQGELTASSLRPRLSFLGHGQIRKLHNAALHILERTGLAIHWPEAVEMLADIGCDTDGKRVRIPSHIVETALCRAPGRITIYNRQGEPAMFLEGLNSYYGPGPTIQYVYDPFTMERRPSGKRDIKRAALLCDYLPNIDFVMTMGMSGGVDPRSQGIPPSLTDRHDFAAMLKSTRKPLCFSTWSQEGLADILEMAAAVRGGKNKVRHQPSMILFTQPISPLTIDTEPIRQILFCAEHGIPFIFSAAPTMGSTAPNTMAGSIAQSLAEFFGALVLAQYKSPGAPIIMGIGYGPMDFKKATSPYNGPEFYLSKLIAKEMASYYSLPDWNYGGCTDAKILDAQAASEAALSLFAATSMGSSLIHDVGYMEMGMTACLELIVLADELAGSFKKFFNELKIDPDTLALDLIDKVGPGGHFLTERHTLDHLHDIWHPAMMDRNNFMQWELEGKVTLDKRLNDKVRWVLENHQPEPLSPEAEQAVEEIMQRAKSQAD